MADVDESTIPHHDKRMKESSIKVATSIVSNNRKKKINGLLIGIFGAIALAAVFFLNNGKTKSTTSVPSLTTAVRKLVPELKADVVVADLPAVIMPTPESNSVDPLQAQRELMEIRRAEKAQLLLEARMKSAIDPGDGSVQSVATLPMTNLPPSTNLPGLIKSGAQDVNSQFMQAASGITVPSSVAASLTNLNFKILQGKVIEAIIVPRAISDLPGTICALIQRDVYAERGRIKLIPWGSRLCGVYSAELRTGQDRLFTIWNTLRVSNPDGSISEIALDSIGSDQLGTAGTGGIVDTHFAEIFGVSALMSIIGAGVANVGVTPTDQNNSAAEYRNSVQHAAAQTAKSTLAPNLTIPPTVTVPAGTRVRVFVNRDLDFSSLFLEEATTKIAAVVGDKFE